jgi:hypothetical protein
MRGNTGKREDREERRQGREKTGKREDREERRQGREKTCTRSEQSIVGTRRGAMALSGGREAHR